MAQAVYENGSAAAQDQPAFISSDRVPARPLTAGKSSIRFRFWQALAVAISTGFLIFLETLAICQQSMEFIRASYRGTRRKPVHRDWDNPDVWAKEAWVKDDAYYAKSCGYDLQEQEVTTEDGFKLRVYKILAPNSQRKINADGKGGFPVLLMHGLLVRSGTFITSEERSLPFYLAERGYQVYLGNNRGICGMGHVSLSKSDSLFWDHDIKEYAMHDIPALVNHVRNDSEQLYQCSFGPSSGIRIQTLNTLYFLHLHPSVAGYNKIAYIGHSQGNATMFITLAKSIRPDVGDSISVFVALAPAVFAGPITTEFPFSAVCNVGWARWKRLFGVLDFMTVMQWAYGFVPARLFAYLGYQMFAYLFHWTDTNWLVRRKPKMFRFAPAPVSSANIYWWAGRNGFTSRGCALNDNAPKWFEPNFPPLSLYYGGQDRLVSCQRLLDRLASHEQDVQVIRIHCLPDAEHLDMYAGADAVEDVFVHIVDDIERTRQE